MNGKVLNAELRDVKGKNNCRRLRGDGLIPAVVYSHGESETINIKSKDFFSLFKGRISESVIFNLNITGKEGDDAMAFVKDYQKDAVTGEIRHVDLFKVTKGEKIKTTVPIELVGTPKGLKLGGVFEQGDREVMVECLPKDLPEKIVVNIEELLVGDNIHVKDLEVAEGVEILNNPIGMIAAVSKPKVVEEETEEADVEEIETGETSTEE